MEICKKKSSYLWKFNSERPNVIEIYVGKKIPDSRAPQGRRAPQTALVPLILAHIVGAPPEVRPPP